MPVTPQIGTISMVGFTFAPAGWLPCDGRTLAISQYDTLFAVIGTTYGGDGQSTFALPDLRGRVPIHQGTGGGLSNRTIGERAGTETVALNVNQMPPHSHAGVSYNNCASTLPATQTDPAGHVFAVPNDGSNAYAANGNGLFGGSGNVSSSAGGGQPHSNLQPLLCINFIIAVDGVFPQRN